ncbi:RNA methyltransferase [bacterium]|nr:RNA methyltransferase [bacterium]
MTDFENRRVVAIESLDDSRLDPFRSLKTSNATRDDDLFVVEGALLVERLLASRFETVSVLTHTGWFESPKFELPHDAPVMTLTRPAMTDLVGFSFHQGILACGRRRPWPSMSEIVGGIAEREKTVVICPAIDNPENLGSIARTADALGVAAIVVGKESPDSLSRRVTRVSMGATLRLPILEFADVHEALDELASLGFEFVATLPGEGHVELLEFRRPERVGLLLGREREGLAAEFEARADHKVTISMTPGADSLNVGVAAGVFLYWLRQGGRSLR